MRHLFLNKCHPHWLLQPGQQLGRPAAFFTLPRTNLSFHLLAIIFVAVLLGMAGSAFYTLSMQRAQLIENAQLSAERMSAILRAGLEHAMVDNDRRMMDQILGTVVGETGIERMRVLNARGQVRASSMSAEVGRSYQTSEAPCSACHLAGAGQSAPPLPAAKMLPRTLLNVDVITNAPACYACHDEQTDVLGLLLVETPLTELDGQLAAGVRRSILAVAVTFALLVVVLVPTLRRLVFRPINGLARAAAEIGAGNLSHPVELGREDELGQLGAAFDHMRQQLLDARHAMEERNQELQMLNDVARAASELLDPQQILELSIGLVVSSPFIAAGGIFLIDPECGRLHFGASRGICQPDCVRMACQLHALRDCHSEQLAGRGGVIRQGVIVLPVKAGNDVSQSDISECYWVGVPLLARGTEVGILALVTAPGHPLTKQGVSILKAMGEEIGVAIANALQYQRVKYQAAAEERDRLAREMHDSLAQTLGYLKLKASMTDQLLASGDVDQAQTSLREVKAIAGETYTDVRETIFGLRHLSAPGVEFLPALKEFLAEYRAYYGIDVQLVCSNGHRPDFSSDVSLQITRIIQEALTNVRKHAEVKQATIRFELADRTWHITIEDQGLGFDPISTGTSGPQFLGLQIMRERAEGVGGRLELSSRRERGTRVILSVPAPEKAE